MNTYIDKVALIYLQDKKILMAKSKGKELWFNPGGKREGNETDEETLIREIKEELSVDLDPASVRYYGSFEAQAYGKPEGTIVRMRCYTGTFSGTPTPGNEVAEVGYLSYNEKHLATVVDHLIFDELKAKGLIE
ncbi:MAG: NUDIX domain-containing protein [bacterium]|nr:NUDIX domain-containing protein [bacterium]